MTALHMRVNMFFTYQGEVLRTGNWETVEWLFILKIRPETRSWLWLAYRRSPAGCRGAEEWLRSIAAGWRRNILPGTWWRSSPLPGPRKDVLECRLTGRTLHGDTVTAWRRHTFLKPPQKTHFRGVRGHIPLVGADTCSSPRRPWRPAVRVWGTARGLEEPESAGISSKLRRESSTAACRPATGETTGRSGCLALRSDWKAGTRPRTA